MRKKTNLTIVTKVFSRYRQSRYYHVIAKLVGAFGRLKETQQWLMVIALCLVMIGLTFAVDFSGNKKIDQNSNAKPTATAVKATSSPRPTVTPPASWKTFRSRVHLYEVQYPGDWFLKEEDNHVMIADYDIDKVAGRSYIPEIDGDRFLIDIKIDHNYTDTREWFETQKDTLNPATGKPYEYENLGPKWVDSQQGISYEIEDPADKLTTYHTIFTSPYDYIVHLRGISSGNYQDYYQYKEILDTFRFIDRATVEEDIPPETPEQIPLVSTENWRTVGLDNISFKVPEEAKCFQADFPSFANGSQPTENDDECNMIYLKDNDYRLATVITVKEYLGGSRRAQFCLTGAGKENWCDECKAIYREGYFGNIKGLQVPIDGGWCQGSEGGAVLVVVGEKLVIIRNLYYDPETKAVIRFPMQDTIISTLKAK